MKKLSFILGLFYLLSAVGYGLEVHYCLGQVSDVNLSWLDTSCVCDESASVVAHKCCDEKEFFVQIEEPHQLAAGWSLMDHAPMVVENHFEIITVTADSKNLETFRIGADPPDLVEVYKKNCAFIFYG